MCAGNYSQVHPPLMLCRCCWAGVSRVFESGVILSHALLPQAIDVWSVGCVLAELYQLFKSDSDKRSFRPFFNGTIKLRPGEREGALLARRALFNFCSRIPVELFCVADSQCTQAELLLKTIFSIIGECMFEF